MGTAPHTSSTGELLLNLLTPLHTLLHLIKGPASNHGWITFASPTFLGRLLILIFLTGWEGRRLPSNYQKIGINNLYKKTKQWHLPPLPLRVVVVKPDGNPPPQFSAETPSLTHFSSKGLGRVCLYPFYHFQTMLLLPMRRVSSSPIYLSVTSASSQNLWESISSLQQYSLFHIAPCILTTGCWYLCRQTLLLGQQWAAGWSETRGWDTVNRGGNANSQQEICLRAAGVLWWVGVDFKANLLSRFRARNTWKSERLIQRRKHFQLTANTTFQNFMEWVPNELKH